jgi:hypothetical protein
LAEAQSRAIPVSTEASVRRPTSLVSYPPLMNRLLHAQVDRAVKETLYVAGLMRGAELR